MSDFEARPFELTAKDTEGKVKEVTERLEAGVRELFESERYQAGRLPCCRLWKVAR